MTTTRSWTPAPHTGSADWENARRHFAARTRQDWEQLFTDRPDVVTEILRDIFRETRAEKERASGHARIGRRPRVMDGSMDELWAMVTPKYSMDPFPVAMAELRGQRSMRAFASRVNLPRRTLEHMMAGTDGVRPDMSRLERIATACGVSPAYFREWREAYVLSLVGEMLARNPNLSVQFSRSIIRAS